MWKTLCRHACRWNDNCSRTMLFQILFSVNPSKNNINKDLIESPTKRLSVIQPPKSIHTSHDECIMYIIRITRFKDAPSNCRELQKYLKTHLRQYPVRSRIVCWPLLNQLLRHSLSWIWMLREASRGRNALIPSSMLASA